MIKKEETICVFYVWCMFGVLTQAIFFMWEVLVGVLIALDCGNIPYIKPSNCAYSAVLAAGISCLILYNFPNSVVWMFVLSSYDSKYSKMEKENSELEEQIASLERQLNQRVTSNFVRSNNDVPPYTEENRPSNNEVNQAS